MTFFDEGENLKKRLLKEYGTFADKRIKNVAKGNLFIADDRSTGDYGADRSLFLWFCALFVDVKNDAEVEIRLVGGIPIGPAVKKWILKSKAKYSDQVTPTLTFTLHKGQQDRLLELASAIASITEPGAPRYTVPAYKYVCPRTAASLRRLAKVLNEFWT
jgi:hypothetical protein